MKKVNELLVERGIHIPKVETHTPEIKTQQIVDSFVKKNEEEGLRIFVAGGSRSGNSPVYEEEAYALGSKIAEMNFKLDFGLSSHGIMGAVAKGVLNVWAKQERDDVPIKGITTKEYLAFCQKDEVIEHIHDVIVAHTLEERKNQLLNADFVIFAPGGIGTLDELVYDCVAMQDGFLPLKPFIIFNVEGHYYHVLEYLKEIYIKGFSNATPFIVVDNSEEAGVAFQVLKYKYKVPPKKENVLSTVEDIIHILPYVIEEKQTNPRTPVETILKRIESTPELAEDIEKAYLRKEIERMYGRLEKAGQDTASVSEKLTGLKQRRKKVN
ncbi:MAG: LOG family protein [Alphaproteobacteria bacterium]|nr:LOG family protein [Alphaproteobacteria bacterium]